MVPLRRGKWFSQTASSLKGSEILHLKLKFRFILFSFTHQIYSPCQQDFNVKKQLSHSMLHHSGCVILPVKYSFFFT